MQADTLDIVLALVVAIVLHELAHGVVARLLGEATAVRAAAMAFLRDFSGQRLPRVWHV